MAAKKTVKPQVWIFQISLKGFDISIFSTIFLLSKVVHKLANKFESVINSDTYFHVKNK